MIATTTRAPRRVALTAAVVVALFATACRPAPLGATDIYIVKSVGTDTNGNGTVPVTCESTKHPGKTKTVPWDALVQTAPEVGAEWRCNNSGGG